MSHLSNRFHLPRHPLRSSAGWPRPPAVLSSGLGAIFRVQRVRPEGRFACDSPALAELDPFVFEEFVRGAAATGAEFVRLGDIRQHLAMRKPVKIFALSFDVASRGILRHAYPLLKALGVPFTVFVSPAMHDEGLVPWWFALEELVERCERLSLALRGHTYHASCRSLDEKAEALDNLIPLLMAHPEPAVRRAVYGLCEGESLSIAEMAAAELLSWEEIKTLAGDPLVSIGLLAADCHNAGNASYDAVQDCIAQERLKLAGRLGAAAPQLGFSAGWHGYIEPHHLQIAASLGFETACLPAGGVLLPEEPAAFLSLPRLLLSNEPSVMQDAQAVCGFSLVPYRSLQQGVSAA